MESVEAKNEHELAVQKMEQSCKCEIKAINGLKSISYFFLVMLVASYFQMDLIKKNRWKDFEVMNTNKMLMVAQSTIYLHIDNLLFLIAFTQSEKIFAYFKQVDQNQDEEEKT